MSRIGFGGFMILVLATSGSWGAPAQAQDGGLITQKAISYDMAQQIVQGAISKCRSDNQHVSVSVVDAAGLTKITVRDDGSGVHTIDISRRKAYTALITRRSTADTVAAIKGNPGRFDDGVVVGSGGLYSAGGLPIRVGDQTIGGVGVSGGNEDDACAAAGLATVADKLK
jgi:uncharacterized protein GlcG (DUF336 family)